MESSSYLNKMLIEKLLDFCPPSMPNFTYFVHMALSSMISLVAQDIMSLVPANKNAIRN